MKKHRLIVGTAALSLLLAPVSCLFNPVDLGGTDDLRNEFELVWRTFDEQYACFRFSDIDWNEAHMVYGAMAEEAVTQARLMDILYQMLAELEDPGIVLSDDSSSFETCPLEIEPNCDMDVLWSYLEPREFEWFVEDIWGWCFFDSTLYVMIPAWSSSISNSELTGIVESHPGIDAVVFDMRMNGGDGIDTRLGEVARVFNGIVRIGFFTVARAGPGHGDLTSLHPRSIPRTVGSFEGPVAVLFGEQCGRTSEKFACMVSEIPTVTTIGDTTMRHSDWVTNNSLPGNCAFTLPESTIIRADSITWVHEAGVPPDIFVDATEADFLAGVDPVLEYALEWAAGRATPR